MAPSPKNVGAEGIPFYTPVQSPPAGTALSPKPPTLFTPLKIRDVTFHNRIWVAPMCTYSASTGHLTDFHLIHLSAFAYRGASLTIIEATAVLPNGRITPEDSGLWTPSQIPPIRRIANFIHSQNTLLGIQLAHAGRKASTVAPWLVPKNAPGTQRMSGVVASKEVGGWPGRVWGPSKLRWGEGYCDPKEMSIAEIEETIQAFGKSAKWAVEAGIDVVEIHAAHGYLLTSFLSPISNRRTDQYGGSFENRIRMLVEVIKSVRENIPEGMPLLLRISATEWMDGEGENGSWDVEQSIRLAKLLPGLGVDLLDVSSGGNHPAQKIEMHNDFQVGIAGRIRKALYDSGITNLRIGAVGMITEAEMAREAVEAVNIDGDIETAKEVIVKGVERLGDKGDSIEEMIETETGEKLIEVEGEHGQIAKADIVLVARQFLREPEWVLRVAYRLGVEVKWPIQYHRGQFLRGSRI